MTATAEAVRDLLGRVDAMTELVRRYGDELHVQTRDVQAGAAKLAPEARAAVLELDGACGDLASAVMGLRGTVARTAEAARTTCADEG